MKGPMNHTHIWNYSHIKLLTKSVNERQTIMLIKNLLLPVTNRCAQVAEKGHHFPMHTKIKSPQICKTDCYGWKN